MLEHQGWGMRDIHLMPSVCPGMSPGASGKGGNAASSFSKVNTAVDGVGCRPSSSGRAPVNRTQGYHDRGTFPGSSSDLLLSRRVFKALKQQWEGWCGTGLSTGVTGGGMGLRDAPLGELSSPSLPCLGLLPGGAE